MKKKYFIAAAFVAFMAVFSVMSAKNFSAAAEKIKIHGPYLCINQVIDLYPGGANKKALKGVEITLKDNDGIAAIEGGRLRALAQGKFTVVARKGKKSVEKEFIVKPYVRVCGADLQPREGCNPMIVWVDFNGDTDEIANVELVGDFSCYLDDKKVEEFAGDYFKIRRIFRNVKAGDVDDIKAKDGEQSVAEKSFIEAISDACRRYRENSGIIIRPFQTLMTGRYLINNPYIPGNSEDAVFETKIIASYPAGKEVAQVVNEDVGEEYAGGVARYSFEDDAGKKYQTVHNIVVGKSEGVALIEYSCNGKSVLDGVAVYDNFTEGQNKDIYGKVLYGPKKFGKKGEHVVIGVLSDKAMNYVGGGCGPNVLDVMIDAANKKIECVKLKLSSDSTYLANDWEFEGKFKDVGNKLYDLPAYLEKFKGLPARQIAPYDVEGDDVGEKTEGGIDMVMTGATRTANSIIYAVNEAIALFLRSVQPS